MTRTEAIKILSCRDNRGLPITWQDGFVDAVDTAIEALKAQLSEEDTTFGKWIPVSERLPSTEHNLKGFLTTVRWYEYEAQGDYEYYETSDVFVLVYENGKFGHWDGEKLIPNDDVIAWMPLPEPYTEEKQ